jgi:hypothetical protein
MIYDTLVDPIVERLVIEAAAQMPDVPGDLEKNFQTAGGWAGFLSGAAGGAMVGAHVGIAAGPLGAIAGTVPGAVIGGVMGFFGGQKVGERFDAES